MKTGRVLAALVSFGVGAVVLTGAFTSASAEDFLPASAEASDRTSDRMAIGAIGGCAASCDNTAKSCVKKCVVERKPCMEACDIDPDDNPKSLKPKDQACLKACFDKSRPCQQRCQSARAVCARSCPN